MGLLISNSHATVYPAFKENDQILAALLLQAPKGITIKKQESWLLSSNQGETNHGHASLLLSKGHASRNRRRIINNTMDAQAR